MSSPLGGQFMVWVAGLATDRPMNKVMLTIRSMGLLSRRLAQPFLYRDELVNAGSQIVSELLFGVFPFIEQPHMGKALESGGEGGSAAGVHAIGRRGED